MAVERAELIPRLAHQWAVKKDDTRVRVEGYRHSRGTSRSCLPLREEVEVAGGRACHSRASGNNQTAYFNIT